MGGERAQTKDCLSLGKFDLSGIPPAPRGVPQIEVSFDVDVDGILSVNAADKSNGNSKSIKIENNKGRLDEAEIERMVADAEKYKAEDEAVKARLDANQQADKDEYEDKQKELQVLSDPIIKKAYANQGVGGANVGAQGQSMPAGPDVQEVD